MFGDAAAAAAPRVSAGRAEEEEKWRRLTFREKKKDEDKQTRVSPSGSRGTHAIFKCRRQIFVFRPFPLLSGAPAWH